MAMDDLEPLDPEFVRARLSKPPFVSVPGVVNVRDLGSYSTTYPGMITKPKLLYRSGEISNITEEGKERLKELGIGAVYDLRSDTEIAKYNTPCPVIEGIEVIRTPVFKHEDYTPEMMAKRFELYASGKIEAFMELYSQILEHGGPAFGAILRYIRDHPESGCMFHCTAGKDRTGVVAALLLKLAGVDDDAIAEDYSLTRIGREPMRDQVMERLAKVPLFAADNEKALNMLTSRKEVMSAFLKEFDNKYGGVECYLKTHVHLSDEDIDTVRRNILTPQSRH
ncbi:protein-tyrosine phosphatase-like protein [Irpex rosettiformis]|uniref:Protein-tyrosine phosphatase-like protein n=1 Tax=Irpex rosettiformis TaxID=378272 RepID=A0ACB8UDR1_9APHY|nr:protein-tyrosine phosphatase-like protein [Irpex rosettiformis]